MAKELHRDRIHDALGSFSLDASTHTNYADESEANKDTWLANNSDRVLFGAATSNNSSNDHSASLANCDTTADLLIPDTVSLLKRLAKTANPKIRPINVKDDEEWYCLLCPSKPFADLHNHADMLSANRDAWTRGKDNPLFTGGDLLWDGIIVKEVPEIAALPGTPGASGTTSVAPCYLLGAQALAWGVAQRTRMIENVRDYGAKKGADVELVDIVRKMYFGTGASDTTTPKQHGVATLYVAFAGT